MKKKSKPSSGLTKGERSKIVKKAKSGKDIGKKGKAFKDVEKKAMEQYGDEEIAKQVAGAAMWRSVAKKKRKAKK